MKNYLKTKSAFFLAGVLLISSCADPAQEGSKLADDYCRCISKYTELDAVAGFVRLERQCADFIEPELAELRKDFSGNSEKLATLNPEGWQKNQKKVLINIQLERDN